MSILMSLRREWPLVAFTLLLPTSVAMYLFAFVLPRPALSLRPSLLTLAWALSTVALLAGPFHLGRPLRAPLIALNVAHSWLAREVVCSGLYVGLLFLHVLETRLQPSFLASRTIGAITLGFGVAAVLCGARAYVTPARPGWRFALLARSFALTGTTAALLLALVPLSTLAAVGSEAADRAGMWLLGAGIAGVVLQVGVAFNALWNLGLLRRPSAGPSLGRRLVRVALGLQVASLVALGVGISLERDTLVFMLALGAFTMAAWLYRLMLFASSGTLAVPLLAAKERRRRLVLALGDGHADGGKTP
jgi:DMSO reductase anchor subunit